MNPSALRVSATGRLKDAVLGTAYTETLQANGGRGSLHVDQSRWNAAPGLTLAADGSVSGSPSVSGIYRFTVRVADADRGLATGVLELRVVPARSPNVSFGDLPDIIAPAQQPRVRVTIDEPYPTALRGVCNCALPRSGPERRRSRSELLSMARGRWTSRYRRIALRPYSRFRRMLCRRDLLQASHLDATLATGDFDVTPNPSPAKAIRVTVQRQ